MSTTMLRFTIILLTLTLFFSCENTSTTTQVTNNESSIDIPQTLTGKWILHEGIRNGKSAPTLEGVSFDFSEGNQLSSNLMGVMELTSYTLTGEDMTIEQRGGKMDTDYSIDLITADSLNLSTTLRGFEFLLQMVRDTTTSEETTEQTEESIQ